MELFNMGFEYMWCLIEALLFAFFLGQILGRSERFKIGTYLFLSFLISIIIFNLTIINIRQELRMLIGVGIYFIYSLAFKGKLTDKVFYNLLFNLIQIVSEILPISLIGYIFDISAEDIVSTYSTSRIIIGLLVKFVKCILLLIIVNHISPEENILPKRYNLLVWSIYGFSIISMIFLFDVTRGFDEINEFSLLLIFICSSYFIINAAVYIFMRELNKHYIKEKERAIIDLHYKATDIYLKMNEETNQQIRKIRHDINNHMINIKNMISSKASDKIDQYINEIIGDVEAISNSIRSGNEIADIVLNQKNIEAKKHNIDFIVNAAIPPDISINQVDLSSLLFNSIDNAIEASLGIEDISKRRIKINIHPKKDYLYFEIINSIQDNIIIHRGMTSKANKENHGYGLIILEDIVSKYDGFMDYEIVDKEFRIYMAVLLEKNTTSFTKNATSYV